ncbi:hypothetical protein DZC30_02475 [Comamonas testosteroni]|uniref:Uncharacterized protein n=1 Tax=Comamonas testosteroni TaxID=285 RepID=A0A373FR63_COMTE|nr:hypothetical protein [Comamonas testosteroni]RGE46661.1 hypothetical protein DZC30_02475 [Comamonas testosteroni]
MFARIKTFCSYIKSNWETWAALAVTVLLGGFEGFSDYLPLIAGTLSGWQLVALTGFVSFALAWLRARKRRAACKRKHGNADCDEE